MIAMSEDKSSLVDKLVQCPNQKCRMMFIPDGSCSTWMGMTFCPECSATFKDKYESDGRIKELDPPCPTGKCDY